MKKLVILFILFCTAIHSFCHESNLKVKILDFKDVTVYAYKEFYEHYGKLYLFYKESPYQCQRYNAHTGRFEEKYDVIIEKLEYYYKKDNNLYYIGKINLDGVFDKNDKCIIPFPKISETIRVDGYNSEILESPFYNSIIITENGSSRKLDSYGYFRMNYITNTFETFNPFNSEE